MEKYVAFYSIKFLDESIYVNGLVEKERRYIHVFESENDSNAKAITDVQRRAIASRMDLTVPATLESLVSLREVTPGTYPLGFKEISDGHAPVKMK